MVMNQQIWMAFCLLAMSLAGYAIYQWQQREHVRGVENWVKDYLRGRYGSLPNQLHIHDSSDRLWPVLVRFDLPGIEVRHRMQFECGGPPQTWSLISERDEQR